MRALSNFLVIGVAFCVQCVHADTEDIARRFAEECREAAKKAEACGRTSVEGRDGWFFLTSELRHVGMGRFWGRDAARVSRAVKPENADPLPAIIDFNEQLRQKGIELIFVPVPPKAVVYPDMLSGSIASNLKEVMPRLDIAHQEFYEVLRNHGVRVLDLAPVFLAARGSVSRPVYCRQDSHWSGAGIELAAGEIARRIKAEAGFQSSRNVSLIKEQRTVEITGDLVAALKNADVEHERLQLAFINATSDSALGILQPDRDSPVLLMGDSHTIVFHAGGDMHATGAGLPDHLAYELGRSIDLIGVRGSGATPSRINLFRRGSADSSYLAKKKVVIWCVSAREFTESSGWRKVPVSR